MTITLITASFIGLLTIILVGTVIFHRNKSKTSIGVREDSPELLKAVRAHGNLIEFAPIFLILLGLLEYMRANVYLLIGLGAGFVVARIFHAYGITRSKTVNRFRFMGTLASIILLVVASLAGLATAYRII